MEKIAIHIQVPPHVKEYEEKQLKMLEKSTYLSDYIKNNHMTAADLQSYAPFFVAMMEELKECKECIGLQACVKRERGYVSMLKKEGIVQWFKSPCKYQKEEMQSIAQARYYSYKKLSPELLALSFQTIDLKAESKDYLRVLKEISKWSTNPTAKGFYLHGAPGTGKTYLMVCLLNQFASEKKTVAFVNVLELAAQNKLKVDFDMLRKIMSADFVVMDDIGAEAVTTLIRDELLFTILDDRMSSKKLTCFTSNYNMEQLFEHFSKNQYGDVEPMKALRLMERIKALSKEVELHGKSRR